MNKDRNIQFHVKDVLKNHGEISFDFLSSNTGAVTTKVQGTELISKKSKNGDAKEEAKSKEEAPPKQELSASPKYTNKTADPKMMAL